MTDNWKTRPRHAPGNRKGGEMFAALLMLDKRTDDEIDHEHGRRCRCCGRVEVLERRLDALELLAARMAVRFRNDILDDQENLTLVSALKDSGIPVPPPVYEESELTEEDMDAVTNVRILMPGTVIVRTSRA